MDLQNTSETEKVVSLFQFLREMAKSRKKVITSIDSYKNNNFYIDINEIPKNDNIELHYYDEEEEILFEENPVILKVHKPEVEVEKCPLPNKELKQWLEDGFDDYKKSAKYKVEIKNENDEVIDKFDNHPDLKKMYNHWVKLRDDWAQKQKEINQVIELFTKLYDLHNELKKDSETFEIIVSNGLFVDTENKNIKHPILTKRIQTRFDPEENIIYLVDSNMSPELYTTLFQNTDDLNTNVIGDYKEELQENEYHPLNRNETKDFLKRFIHAISSDSIFIDDEKKVVNSRYQLRWKPYLILRNRPDGTLKALETIIEHIDKTGEFPHYIQQLVSGGENEVPEYHEESIDEQLAAVGGESLDILLSKQANKEQLEIAKQIEKYDAVLVQGPPGTGKTHTIANLLGHFLAKGNSVLVTSYTKKALNVLKDKLEPNIRNLCVSVLDDSNEDMEKSVDGISDYMAQNNSFELEKEMNVLNNERKEIADELSKLRKKMFALINQERNDIIIAGEAVSVSEASRFVYKYQDDLSYIPGKVRADSMLPLSYEELIELYRSNKELTAFDEGELSSKIIDPHSLISPDDFNSIIANKKKIEDENNNLLLDNDMTININEESIEFVINNQKFTIDGLKKKELLELNKYINALPEWTPWMKDVVLDGKIGRVNALKWKSLIESIEDSRTFIEDYSLRNLGKTYTSKQELSHYEQSLRKLNSIFEKKNKLGFFNKRNSGIKEVIDEISIDLHEINCKEDCQYLLDTLEVNKKQDNTTKIWNELFIKHEDIKNISLNEDFIQSVASKYSKEIKNCLDWFNSNYPIIQRLMQDASIPLEIISPSDKLASDEVQLNDFLDHVTNRLKVVISILLGKIDQNELTKKIEETINILNKRNTSSCIEHDMIHSLKNEEVEEYTRLYDDLNTVYHKSTWYAKRAEALDKIEAVAPEWANAIRQRQGVHGESNVPQNIEEAWKWKQYNSKVQEILKEPYEQLQKRTFELSKQYRKKTAKLAEISAWYHLLKETESNVSMKQALTGWKQTVKKIGKGTGKLAAKYRAEARKLMAQCQNAVPGWIMPINKALETLDPSTNKFDIIIIDEASQADISALSIAYMGKKIIVVGDDKQVSPMAIGAKIDDFESISKMYIQDKINNAHLYTANTSLYDLAATTFHPLMLKEHFRCVPDIINFSNGLSYDYKIKPLRELNNTSLSPSIINYRVDGERFGFINEVEAETIVSLIQACINQPEYDGKSFGVISLLGDQQAKCISQLIYQRIDMKEIESRKILCGIASNFQGDERDVIFLSMVDSPNLDGSPLSRKGEGTGDSNKKRYNVAVSRARDQLWVVNSLDSSNDLKDGDIRRRLLEYASNPGAFEHVAEKVEEKAESPFEERVGKSLVAKGYHIEQQWKVGSYRLDIVAVCKGKTVAIECDGERWHSGEDKIRKDMERQTILERLGWRFIRIRGSEYFLNPDKTMERVYKKLEEYDIYPESINVEATNHSHKELLNRINNELLNIQEQFNQKETF